ncbi:DUF1330 domain-containing protein [Hwanghaeella grinnelliae]|uniref:DUF1330 domain-containing protein n=1 Tax=Hwanghaeella grinnelliae TaxID=2500179 RepID=A0A3S2WQC5_9PROT|nr:DUF1330 domain-containing protein [Hwanghaeella grinnelliae]RVU34922.1 DUF1330 domain-containing protein [Hwanghaeella grinnelliae]
MTAKQNMDDRIDRLLGMYGNGLDGAAPTAADWRRMLEREVERPVTLINLFKLRETALYPAGMDFGGSGKDAFDRYATVSVPSMQSTGGEFLFVGPVEGRFMGAQDDWDIAAIGRYPNTKALLSLFDIEAYRDCYIHRVAACEKQQVTICDG